MLVTQANLDALRVTFIDDFKNVYEGTPVFWEKIATKVGSKTRANTYGWKAMQTRMREWIGPRVAQNLSERLFSIVNRKFEATIELNRDDIEDDNLGVFQSMDLPDLAEGARKHPDQLLIETIQGNPTGFDGVSFFNTAHPTNFGAGTYSNDFTGATAVLDQTGFNNVRSTMMTYTGENGNPLSVNPRLLIVPPQLELKAKVLMSSATYAVPGASGGLSATVDNPLQGMAEVLVIPELGNQPKVWYLADVSRAVKPFVFQERDPVELVQRDNLQDPKVFEQDVFTYGTRCRDNVGPSLPFLIARATEP